MGWSNLVGIIDRIYDSYFYLIDSGEKYSMVVYFDTVNFNNLSQGSEVYVSGKFVYDAETMRFVLRVTEETHSIYKKTKG